MATDCRSERILQEPESRRRPDNGTTNYEDAAFSEAMIQVRAELSPLYSATDSGIDFSARFNPLLAATSTFTPPSR